MKKHFYLLLVSMTFVHFGYSQSDFTLIGGIQVGKVMKSEIRDLWSTILPEPFFINYSKSERKINGWAYGVFINVREETTGLGGQVDLDYAQQYSGLDFNNYANNFSYTMDFENKYVNITPTIKWYPSPAFNGAHLKGFNILTGMQFGISKHSSDIVYKSTGALLAFGSDAEQEQQLRQVLTNRNNIGWVWGAGIESDFKIGDLVIPLILEFKHHVGFVDVIKTQPNSYNFFETDNYNRFYQLTLKLGFGMQNRYSN